MCDVSLHLFQREVFHGDRTRKSLVQHVLKQVRAPNELRSFKIDSKVGFLCLIGDGECKPSEERSVCQQFRV